MKQKHQEFDFKTFLDDSGGDFIDYLDRAGQPDEEDEQLEELEQEILDLYEKYPRIVSIIEKDAPCSLTEEEAAALIHVLENKDEIDFVCMQNIYFKGCADSIAYLRKLKLIKAQTD